MFCYTIGELSITAPSKEEAEEVYRSLFGTPGNKVYFKGKKGGTVVDISDDTFSVYVMNGKSVKHCGLIRNGAGMRLIQSAVNSIDTGKADGIKFRKKARQTKGLDKEREAALEEYQRIIDTFESKVPGTAKVLFMDTMETMCGDNQAYRVEVYQLIDTNITMNHDNWLAILSWFRGNVLNNCDPDFTQFRKRKAFVTTVCRMGEQEIRAGNIIKGVAENDDNFWTEYTKQK